MTLLDAAAVGAELQLRDLRTVRRIMREAGAFEVAGRLRLDPADLRAWLEQRRATTVPATAPRRAVTRRRSTAARAAAVELEAGWWREGSAS